MTDFLPYSRKSNIKKSDKTSTPDTGRYGDVTAPILSSPGKRSVKENKSSGAKASRKTSLDELQYGSSIKGQIRSVKASRQTRKSYGK